MTTLDEIRDDAEAIEHALHEQLLRDLGLRTDAEVVLAIAEVRAEAAQRSLSLAEVAAYDYADNEAAWPPRWCAALWRSCQIHHAQDQYPALTGHGDAHENGAER